MTEGIWIAVLSFAQAVTLALIGKVVKDSSITRKEVKNSHSTNLRVEQDERHDEQMGELRGIRKDIGRLDKRDIARGEDIRELRRKTENNDARIGRLEKG